MASRKQFLNPRSRVFPPFYACYLLKSIQTPLSKATYIGSTPHPPRRIRQHNGEIKQGAWKTHSRRPWIMAMIVHGFPSRLAALQFEWAWQHPQKSRHLRNSDGSPLYNKPKHLKANIQLVYQMISTHPYNTWPLHVKLFSDEAVAAWTVASRDSPPMPQGFTCSIELEGVDGKSGKIGSGRREPINVKDEQFTSSYLAKNTALLARNRPLHCLVCQQELTNYTTDTLSTALCPNSSCTAVFHITCLSGKFLASDSSSTTLIPRGGACPSCNAYTLWGDIIRGSHRRLAGRIPNEIDEEEEDLPNLSEDASDDDELHAELPSPSTKASKRKTKAPATKTRKPRQKAREMALSSEFDFDSDSGPTDKMPRKRGRPPRAASAATTIPLRKKEAPMSSSRVQRPISSEGELFDSDSASLDEAPLEHTKTKAKHDVPVLPRKRGRPRKAPSIAIPSPSVIPKRRPKGYPRAAVHTVASDSSGESFDFDAIGSDSSENDSMISSPGPSNGGTSHGFPHGRLGSSKTAQPSRGQGADTSHLNRVMSSMSISSPSPTHEQHYIEVSD